MPDMKDAMKAALQRVALDPKLLAEASAMLRQERREAHTGTRIDPDLYARVKDLWEWKRSGLLPEGPFREYAQGLSAKYGDLYDLTQMAEYETVRDLLDWVVLTQGD